MEAAKPAAQHGEAPDPAPAGQGRSCQSGWDLGCCRRPKVKYAIGPAMLTNASAVHIRFEPLIWPAGRRLMSMSVATRRTTSTTPVPTIRLRLRLLRSRHFFLAAMTPSE